MRKFNLRENAAKRILSLQRAGRSDSSIKETAEGQTDASAVSVAAEASDSSLLCAWRTDVGRVRKSNQDAVIISESLFGVADGMGGHNGGEIASGELRTGLLRETSGIVPAADALLRAVEKVNGEIYQLQAQDPALSGMGTTLTALWAGKQEMLIAQVGDSRAYLLRDGKLCQITEDHSMVADMVRRGVLTEEQAACHPMRNYITRAVGTDDYVEVDLYTEKRKAGDRWLICSDGLYGQINRVALQEMVSADNLEEAADRLLQTALDNGGKDNISLILLADQTGSDGTEKTPAAAGETNGRIENE